MLGVVGFFLGFAPYAKTGGGGDNTFPDSENFFFNGFSGAGTTCLALLLAAATVAAFGMLPGQRDHNSVVAGLSLAGSVTLLFLLVGLEQGLEAGVGLILVLVAAFLQTALAVIQSLVCAGIIGGRPQKAYGVPPPSDPNQTIGPYDRTQAPPGYRRGPYGPR
ncbi:hypothetical protein MMAD_17520 [Mycolicibacterium madagascariense]|uniref:34 kDa antigenic protein n=1 Tax=Mycolicibacterium madagascariense TaxID=212765 RepID=A0A7I7XEA0_9MYCO|nr:hypothetical protein MMAD_17520 [Mycolicibacterium madagascariense]